MAGRPVTAPDVPVRARVAVRVGGVSLTLLDQLAADVPGADRSKALRAVLALALANQPLMAAARTRLQTDL